MFKKLKFYRKLLIEIIETLCSICVYLKSDSHKVGGNPYADEIFTIHYTALKSFSDALKDNL